MATRRQQISTGLTALRRKGVGQDLHGSGLALLLEVANRVGAGSSEAERIEALLRQAIEDSYAQDSIFLAVSNLWFGLDPATRGQSREVRYREAWGRYRAWARDDPDRQRSEATFRSHTWGRIRDVLAQRIDALDRAHSDKASRIPDTDTAPGSSASDAISPRRDPRAGTAPYYRSPPDEMKRGFFDRKSTKAYIRDLAALQKLTVLLGAGASADVGGPMHDALMPPLLKERVKVHEGHAATPDDIDQAVQFLAQTYGPTYLGSIARELSRKKNGRNDSHFASDISDYLHTRRTTGGFLLRSVGALAFSFRQQGRPVQIVTTNYDKNLDEQEQYVQDYFDHLDLDRYRFLPVVPPDKRPDPSEVEVPTYYVNGSIDEHDHLVIGEADFFARYREHEPDDLIPTWRQALIDDAVREWDCLFIGTSISDPDLLEALAREKYQRKLYAIVIAPDRSFPEPMTDELRSLLRHLVSQRFLHLGIVPIIVDFEHQVPQLLREVTLAAQPDYEPYSDRSDRWWRHWSRWFGYSATGKAIKDPRNERLQKSWMKALSQLRDELRHKSEFLDLPRDSDELIQVEVWIRNPRTRELFLWASSESMWMVGRTAHRFRIDAEGVSFAQQRAFRSGSTRMGQLRRRGVPHYHLSMPLNLHKSPWHLPVGVVTILSSKYVSDEEAANLGGNPRGALQKIHHDRDKLESLEDKTKGIVNKLLDPATAPKIS